MSHKPAQITSGVRTGSKAACAEFFGVSLPAIERGTVGKSWTFDLLAVIRWRMESRINAVQTNPDEMSPADRRAWYYGESTKRKLIALDATLILADDVQATLSAVRALVADSLHAMPGNLERLHGISADVAGHVCEALALTLDSFDDHLRPLMLS